MLKYLNSESRKQVMKNVTIIKNDHMIDPSICLRPLYRGLATSSQSNQAQYDNNRGRHYGPLLFNVPNLPLDLDHLEVGIKDTYD